MYKIRTKYRLNSFYHYFSGIDYPKKHLMWPNFKRPSGSFFLQYCQNCGAYLNEYVTGIKVDENLSNQGICSVCGFNHKDLPEFKYEVDKFKIKLSNSKGFKDTLLDMSFGVEINLNDFFYFACADSYILREEWYGLADYLFEKFGDDGIYGLICWLQGHLPMCEILYHDKRIIQVLKYLKHLTGVQFNPVTREKLTKQILLNKIEYDDFCSYDLEIGVKKGWLSETNSKQFLYYKKVYKENKDTLLKLIKDKK